MMVTGKASELEKVRALRSGADDYVTKPFGLQEVVARVEALLRRRAPRKEPPRTYADGLVEIDFQGAEAKADGHTLELTPLEYRLLSAFVQHPNQVLSADQLLELAWGESGFGRERVKIYVGYLRGKFREAGVEAPIETIRGFGYRYRPPRDGRRPAGELQSRAEARAGMNAVAASSAARRSQVGPPRVRRQRPTAWSRHAVDMESTRD